MIPLQPDNRLNRIQDVVSLHQWRVPAAANRLIPKSAQNRARARSLRGVLPGVLARVLPGGLLGGVPKFTID